jgi:flagellum-specific peptidoglycan hydrolase FlgJ
VFLATRGALWSNSAVLSSPRAHAPVIAALAAVWVTTAAPAAGVRTGSGVALSRASTVTVPSGPAGGPPPTAQKSVESTERSTELGAVVETPAARRLSANTPMAEADAIQHLAQAWTAVTKTTAAHGTLCVLWAHFAHETRRGQRMHAYNFAGLKGRGPTGASVVVWTREGTPGELVQRTFRAYRGPQEGARDYLRLLVDRYPSAVRAAREGNAYSFASALDAGGYFTGDDRAYLRALTSLSIECRRRGLGAKSTTASSSE